MLRKETASRSLKSRKVSAVVSRSMGCEWRVEILVEMFISGISHFHRQESKLDFTETKKIFEKLRKSFKS